MRLLAEHLGVKPMALYHHFANTSEIIDGIVDLVFSEIELPSSTVSPCRRRRCRSTARETVTEVAESMTR